MIKLDSCFPTGELSNKQQNPWAEGIMLLTQSNIKFSRCSACSYSVIIPFLLSSVFKTLSFLLQCSPKVFDLPLHWRDSLLLHQSALYQLKGILKDLSWAGPDSHTGMSFTPSECAHLEAPQCFRLSNFPPLLMPFIPCEVKLIEFFILWRGKEALLRNYYVF